MSNSKDGFKTPTIQMESTIFGSYTLKLGPCSCGNAFVACSGKCTWCHSQVVPEYLLEKWRVAVNS